MGNAERKSRTVGRSLAGHTLLCALSALAIGLIIAFAAQHLQSRQFEYGHDSAVLREYFYFEKALKQWMRLTDLIIGSGETYVAEYTLELGAVLLNDFIPEINASPLAKGAGEHFEAVKSLIETNHVRIDAAMGLDFEEDIVVFSRMLDEYDGDAGSLIRSLQSAKVILEENNQNLIADLQADRDFLLFGGFTALALYVALVLTSWRRQSAHIVRPLENLTDSAKASLTEDAPFNLEQAGPREVRELTHFIQQFVNSLEERIEQRTQDLIHKQQALESEIEERRKAEKRSQTDHLTGVPNRRFFEVTANSVMTESVEFDESMVLMILDLDHFKRVNDTYGHNIGDEVLKAFARTVHRMFREGDLFARLGGEEFGICLRRIDQQSALSVASRVNKKTCGIVVETELGPYSPSVSIGCAMFDGKESLEELIERADRALYVAKENGRNRAEFDMPEAS